MEEKIQELNKKLKEINSKLFMLKMCDHWDDSDYRFANELSAKAKNIKEEISKLEKNKNVIE